MQLDARRSKVHEIFEAHDYANGSGSYHNHNGFQSSSTYHLHSVKDWRMETVQVSNEAIYLLSTHHRGGRVFGETTAWG